MRLYHLWPKYQKCNVWKEMFIFFLTPFFIQGTLAAVKIIDKGLVPLVKNSAGIQFFTDIENDDRSEECLVRTWTKKCCLTDSVEEACDVMNVYGFNHAIIAPRDKQTLVFVYPTLYQHDLVGFCDFILSQRCGDGRNNRQIITIPFDTIISKDGKVPYLLTNYIGLSRVEECSFFDEDSLKDCDPVNCDQKYSGNRPFYDDRLSKCIPAVKCISNIVGGLPDVAIVPKSNICRDLNKPVTAEDIAEISRGFVVTPEVTSESDTSTEGLKLEMISNCSTTSQNFALMRDMVMGKFTLSDKMDKSDYNYCLKVGFMKVFSDIMKISVYLLLLVLVLILFSCLKPRQLKCKWKNMKQNVRDCFYHPKYEVTHVVDNNVRNSLLRDVIVRDIPIELRDSVTNICVRMDRETRLKKRYREEDIGSQIDFEYATSETSTYSDDDDDESSKLLK